MKTIAVTGAGRGIGRAIALKLLGLGYRVAALDLDQDALSYLRELEPSPNLLPLPCDVSQEAQVRSTFEALAREAPSLAGLVNNAARADPRVPPLEDLTLESWHELLGTNLDSVFLCTKHALPGLRSEGGAIVNIASTRALQSEPNTEAYAASKGAVVALTHALAMSLGPRVRVNAVSPGWIDTSRHQLGGAPAPLTEADHTQHPVGRVGVPEDVAELVSFLLSEQAGFITGQHFVIDGGMTRKMIYV